MTKRFLIWFFWYILLTIPFTLSVELNTIWFLVWVIGWWVGLVAWWGTFLHQKYKDRGKVRYWVWGAYGAFLLLLLLGQVRGFVS